MKTIHLYGELGKRFGKRHRFQVASVAEAIRALKANLEGFAPYMSRAHLDGFGFHLKVGATSLMKDDELPLPTSEFDTIKIIPVIMGSGGFFKAFLGAALIIGGLAVSGFSFGALTPLGAQMVTVGAGLVIGGVAQLLTGVPQSPTNASHNTSYLFSGPVNTTAQGGAVPIGYGRLLVGSIVISAGIQTT